MVKVARYDLRNQPNLSSDKIHIQVLPEKDPWTDGGSWAPESENQ